MSETEFLIGRSGLDLQDDFYPEDLPSEWRFDYYSTMFKALSLPIDTDEDLDQIFEDMQEAEEEFELVLSIEQSQLINKTQLTSLLSSVSEHQADFTLFCVVDQSPDKAVMDLLTGYHVCFQSTKALLLGLNEVQINAQTLSFNQTPILYSAEAWDEKQMRSYLEDVSSINAKTILICKFAESSALNQIRIIAELLGY